MYHPELFKGRCSFVLKIHIIYVTKFYTFLSCFILDLSLDFTFHLEIHRCVLTHFHSSSFFTVLTSAVLHLFTLEHTKQFCNLEVAEWFQLLPKHRHCCNTSKVVTLFNNGMHTFHYILASPLVSKEAK